MLSIQSCELSRLDLKGVSLVSVVAGSWPLACFTAELVDVGKTNQTNNRVLRVFLVFCVFGACLRLRDLGEFIFVSRSGLRSFVFVWMSMTLESRDLIGGNGLRTLEVMSHVNMLH